MRDPGPSRMYSPAFWTVSAAHFFFLMGFWMFVLLPLHLARLGATEAWIGALVAIEPAAAVLVRPILGRQLLRHGRRAMMRFGGLVNTAAIALYAAVSDLGAGMIAVRILHGIGVGVLFTTFFTYVADIVPSARRTEALAVFGITAMLPTAMAPLLGEELVASAGFSALFGAAAAFSLASFVCAWALPEPDDVTEGVSRGFWELAGERARRGTWSTTLVFSIAMSSYATFLAPYGQERGLARIGLFFFCYSVAAASLRIVGRRLPDRLGPRLLLVPALASLGTGVYLLAVVDSISVLAMAGTLCGLGHGYLFPILSGLAVADTDGGSRGNAMSLFTAIFDFGQMAGPAALGIVAALVGYPGMFLVVSGAVWLTLLQWLPLRLSRRVS